MPRGERRRVTLDIAVGDPIEGRLQGEDGRARPFVGWIGLARALEEVLEQRPSVPAPAADPREVR